MDPLTLTPEEAERLSGLFDHALPPAWQQDVEMLRTHFLALGATILRGTLPGRPQRAALHHLEEACHQALRAIAAEGPRVLPPHVTIARPRPWHDAATTGEAYETAPVEPLRHRLEGNQTLVES